MTFVPPPQDRDLRRAQDDARREKVTRDYARDSGLLARLAALLSRTPR